MACDGREPPKSPLYRRRFDSETTHNRTDCPEWPERRYIILPGGVGAGSLCAHCERLEHPNLMSGSHGVALGE